MNVCSGRGIALVTGACTPLGRAVVGWLARQGPLVAVVDGDGARLAALVERWQGEGLRIAGRQVDVTSSAAVDALVDQVEREFGPVDALVATAGELRPGPPLSLTDEDWAHSFAVNADGVFHVSRAVAARMVVRERGTIVTVAPPTAAVPRSNVVAHAASRAAAVAYTECLALEVASRGVHCAVVTSDDADRVVDEVRFLLADAFAGPAVPRPRSA
ncbi:SDR family NAD(P)-dependent oxidoreductase [Saccharothrix algeriensis]|uniref:2,3-dihydro-2,3-dihydroxybenzoate dehydrogenase n=1 Tax=Saccharothrix algeriensis TaxID=173560 RepID=A0A8T8HVQ4_9PSEU|nr:SDR family NAD(P)-dependent oxidoreductase [Saccharothrix algeriensis]MBM7814047.1 2,3-dihydro-2,3-dihydroxybenzoate dehydrogenase [Saccharothrix algeriensis]QTR02449.1 SDR family NAD(P)-dependent oxidoreductase [Saccharothrix algeriensis]